MTYQAATVQSTSRILMEGLKSYTPVQGFVAPGQPNQSRGSAQVTFPVYQQALVAYAITG